jgi:hypothetical protein
MMALSALAANFADVQGHWAQTSIERLSAQDIIGGYPNGTFRPNGNITRAEFSAILNKALGLSSYAQPGRQASFRDVPPNHWAFNAIENAKAEGLVTGYPGDLFLPNRNISRAEAMAMMATATRAQYPSEAEAAQLLSQYSDASQVPAWARRAVAAAIQKGLFANDPGSGNRIEAMRLADRGEIAAMVVNLRERMGIARNYTGSQTPPLGQSDATQNNGLLYQTQGQPQGGPAGQSVSSATMGVNDGRTTITGQVSIVPANTRFTGTLTQPIHSELNREGDEVRLTTDQPLLSSDGRLVVPQGSQILGRIANIQPAGRAGKNASIDIDFSQIITPEGRRYEIRGSVATENGELQGGTTKGRILKSAGATAIGAGLGAALGTAMGPLSGGRVGRGAVYGTAVGAGAGAVAAAARKGEEVKVLTGDRLEIKLDQPITIEQ